MNAILVELVKHRNYEEIATKASEFADFMAEPSKTEKDRIKDLKNSFLKKKKRLAWKCN